MKRLIAVVVCLLGVVAFACGASEPQRAGDDQKHAAKFPHAAVAADHALASKAGAEILAHGGNAVDAAVATSFALSVVRPFSCGIGGGGFMVGVMPGADAKAAEPGRLRTFALNYREMCPAAIGPDFYKDSPKGTSTFGGKAVGVPGTVAGLLYALETYGTLKREIVLAPAIKLAREGFAADAAYLKAAEEVEKKFTENPDFRARFGFVWERLLKRGEVKIGDMIALPEQAAAFELIAKDGAKAFHEGPIGNAIVAAITKDGGVLTCEDLDAFKVAELKPIQVEFEGRTLLTMPPPSSGGIAIAQTLGILRQFGLEKIRNPEEPAAYAHVLTEAFKHAFADRAEWLADPTFVDVPIARLLSDEYLKARAATIKFGRTNGPEFYGTREPVPEDDGTSHFCVVDGRGGAVACTETINLEFGSLLAVPEYGFCLNDQMDDFTTRRGEANAFGLKQSDKNLPAPGKRPLSSMSPTIVLDAQGRIEIVVGASGGPRIITGTTQAILNVLVRGMSAGEAVNTGRLHHQWMPNVLEVEENYLGRQNGLGVREWMKKMHHEVVKPKSSCMVQIIVRLPEPAADNKGEAEKWEAACDPRKGGEPAGN